MKKPSTNVILAGLSGVCIVAIALLAFNTWTLSAQLSAIKNTQSQQSDTDWLNDSYPWGNHWAAPGYLSHLQKYMGDVMNDMFFGTSVFDDEVFSQTSGGPAIQMEETPDLYKIVVKVPGGQEVEVNTELKDSQLTIHGMVKSKKQQSQRGLSSRVYQSSEFSQSIYLSQAIDESQLSVEQAENLITITVPKV